MPRRFLGPLLVFLSTSTVYVVFMGERAWSPSPNNHFVHLAHSWLNGQLSVLGDSPPGHNDWAYFGGRWFVSFPPLPAVLLLPLVAIWGTDTLDALVWALVGGVAPALLFALLRRLRLQGVSDRSAVEDLLLVVLFAFGSVYFFVAVQGSVWFAAHVVSSALLMLYLYWALDARRPALAGWMLGLSFMTRASTLFAAPLLLLEALRVCRRGELDGGPRREGSWSDLVADLDLGEALRRCLWFALPLMLVGGLAAWHNNARFEDPFEFGHSYLQIRWRPRIERWGLFSYHYLPRNLGIVMASLPWLTSQAPYLAISRHGLALWLTSPNLVWLLWPSRWFVRQQNLYLCAGLLALVDLLYQNSGWIQFGYRFSLDYMPLLIVALALGGRPLGAGFRVFLSAAVLINAFGAWSFDRAWQYYDDDHTQTRIFQPD